MESQCQLTFNINIPTVGSLMTPSGERLLTVNPNSSISVETTFLSPLFSFLCFLAFGHLRIYSCIVHGLPKGVLRNCASVLSSVEAQICVFNTVCLSLDWMFLLPEGFFVVVVFNFVCLFSLPPECQHTSSMD